MKRAGLLTSAFCAGLLGVAQLPGKFENFTGKVPGSSVSFSMVTVPAGSFSMGSADTEKHRTKEEGPQKKVNISAFWMGEKEVTHDEFWVYFNDESVTRNSDVDAITRPTAQYIDLSWGMGKQGGFPFNSMSQSTALMYCRWLYKKTGVFYRLPTEAEWEYACRAGSTSTYFFGNDVNQLDEYAWHEGNSGNKYHQTGLKKPNAWGLYDMLGNVAEWTIDQFKEDYLAELGSNPTDPMMEPTSRYPKTLKGGGYTTPATMMRCAGRFKSDAAWNKRDPQIPKSKWWLTDAAAVGFRLVAPLKQPSPEEANAFYDRYLSR